MPNKLTTGLSALSHERQSRLRQIKLMAAGPHRDEQLRVYAITSAAMNAKTASIYLVGNRQKGNALRSILLRQAFQSAGVSVPAQSLDESSAHWAEERASDRAADFGIDVLL